MNHKTYLVVAVDENGGIGKAGTLPWRLKDDMRFFKEITTQTRDPEKQNMVIMGRATWESIPEKFRPLPNRKNVVLTTNPGQISVPAEVLLAGSLKEALALANNAIESIFIIGGGMVFKNCIQEKWLTGIYITRIHSKFECDTFFPEIPSYFSRTTKLGEGREGGMKYEFLLLERDFSEGKKVDFSGQQR